jgi:hypothetical protein
MKNIFILLIFPIVSFTSWAQTTSRSKAGYQVNEAEIKSALGQSSVLAYHQASLPQAAEVRTEQKKATVATNTSQSYVFGDTKARIKVTLHRSDDSLTLKFEFANQSTSSFYIDAVKPISYQWSPSGNELILEYGSDGTKESGFPVTQIKGGETNDLIITLPRKTNKFKMNLLVAYFESSSSATQTQLSGKGNWKWSAYKVPVLLKN